MFGYDLGIDLGSASIVISVPGKGIVVNEPSYVAYDTEKEKVLYAGRRAYYLEGREPIGVTVIQPIANGVVTNYDVACHMVKLFVDKVIGKSIFKPRVVASVSALSTDVERRTLISVLISAGARSVCLVEEPLCAAFGAGVVDVYFPGSERTGSAVGRAGVGDAAGTCLRRRLVGLGAVPESHQIWCAFATHTSACHYVKLQVKQVLG